MDSCLKIYVDRLREGKKELLDWVLPPDFLHLPEKDEVSFAEDVKIKGEAYLAENEVVLHLDLLGHYEMPCSICNEKSRVLLHLPNFYASEAMDNIKGAIWEVGEILRQAMLLELPSYLECHEGHCPQRKTIEKYFIESEEHDTHPFARLLKDAKVVEE